jgi:L-threonylcarbamoyladenylate synthase
MEVLESNEGTEIRSPGLKHKHYSPRAEVVVITAVTQFSPTVDDAYAGLNPPPAPVGVSRTFNSVEEYAASLFEFFRECDRRGVKRIYCEAVEEQGIGGALMDRIRRASEA